MKGKLIITALLFGVAQVIAQGNEARATVFKTVEPRFDVQCTDEAEVMLYMHDNDIKNASEKIVCSVKTNQDFWNVRIKVDNNGRLKRKDGKVFKTDYNDEVIRLNVNFAGTEDGGTLSTIENEGGLPIPLINNTDASFNGDLGTENLAGNFEHNAMGFTNDMETTSNFEIRAGIRGTSAAVLGGRYESTIFFTAIVPY